MHSTRNVFAMRCYYFIVVWIPIVCAIWNSDNVPSIGLTEESSSGWSIVTWTFMTCQLMLWIVHSSPTTMKHMTTVWSFTVMSLAATAVVTLQDELYRAFMLMTIIPVAHHLYRCREDTSDYLFSYKSNHTRRALGVLIMFRDAVFGSLFAVAAIMLVNVLMIWAAEEHAESLRIVFILEYGLFVSWIVTDECKFNFTNRLTHAKTNRYDSGKQADPQANPFTGVFALLALFCVIVYDPDYDVVLSAILAGVGVFAATVTAFMSQVYYLKGLDSSRIFDAVNVDINEEA